MEPRARYFLVGVVVIVLASALSYAAFWLSRRNAQDASKSYTIYFKNFSLSGMQVNSVVTMRGIQVGKVRELSITPGQDDLVRVVVDVAEATPIRAETQAVVNRNLLTGLASIDLQKGSVRQTLELSRRDAYPIIPEGQTPLGAIQESLPQIVDKASELIMRANAILSDENRENLSQILKNVSQVSNNLKDRDQNFSKLLIEVQALAKDTRNLINDLDQQSVGIGTTLDKTSTVLRVEMANLSRSLNQASNSLSSVLERYEDPRSILAGSAAKALGPGEERQR